MSQGLPAVRRVPPSGRLPEGDVNMSVLMTPGEQLAEDLARLFVRSRRDWFRREADLARQRFLGHQVNTRHRDLILEHTDTVTWTLGFETVAFVCATCGQTFGDVTFEQIDQDPPRRAA